MLPLLGIAAVLLAMTILVAMGTTRASRNLFHRRLKNRLLAGVFSRALAIPVFLLGLYLALRVSGLTQMAATVLGGTGLLGLIIGIAFRDIAENFLASVLISVQRPFAIGDLIEIDGRTGVVQSVTSRGTLLMAPDGNHLQIPNSLVYKSVIRNITSNPNIRGEFLIGIDYSDGVAQAQALIMDVLKKHEAVLDIPEPMVLVEALGASTVNIRVYFWLNGHNHSPLKVNSSVIRLTKLAIEQAGLTMPDESREVLFPQGVPVRMLDSPASSASQQSLPTREVRHPGMDHSSKTTAAEEATIQNAEGNLSSEKPALEEQARRARNPEPGNNLLLDNN
jgi:small-conductance mechanosensitive channel